MLDWFFNRGFQPDRALDQVNTRLIEAGRKWTAADHFTKMKIARLLLEMLTKLIPDYDLSRGIYDQFVAGVTKLPVDLLNESVKRFGDIASMSEDHDPELFVATQMMTQLFEIFVVGSRTRDPNIRLTILDLYSAHTRTINDVIQYAIFHRMIELSEGQSSPNS